MSPKIRRMSGEYEEAIRHAMQRMPPSVVSSSFGDHPPRSPTATATAAAADGRAAAGVAPLTAEERAELNSLRQELHALPQLQPQLLSEAQGAQLERLEALEVKHRLQPSAWQLAHAPGVLSPAPPARPLPHELSTTPACGVCSQCPCSRHLSTVLSICTHCASSHPWDRYQVTPTT